MAERTAVYAEDCVRFCKMVPLDAVTRPIVVQLVRSSTSIGANYHEANNAESRNDFKHKICICRKESKETMYWFRIMGVAVPSIKERADILLLEADELNRIFNQIVNTLKSRE